MSARTTGGQLTVIQYMRILIQNRVDEANGSLVDSYPLLIDAVDLFTNSLSAGTIS